MWSPSERIWPVSSASRTNSTGLMAPKSGWRQRASASNLRIMRAIWRLVDRLEIDLILLIPDCRCEMRSSRARRRASSAMVSLKVAACRRPDCLATCSAKSASRSRLSMSSVWGSPNATPIETPFTTVCPASGKGEAVFSTTALAKDSTASRLSPSMIATNSSPLMRAMKARSPSTALIVPAVRQRSSSPAPRWPSVAFTALKSSMSAAKAASIPVRAKGRPPAMTLCNSARLGSPVKAS